MTNETKPPDINDPDTKGIGKEIAEAFADVMHRVEVAHRGNPDFNLLVCGVMARLAMIAVMDGRFTADEFHARALDLWYRVNCDPHMNNVAQEVLADAPPLHAALPSLH